MKLSTWRGVVQVVPVELDSGVVESGPDNFIDRLTLGSKVETGDVE